jgi:hypothetical protein
VDGGGSIYQFLETAPRLRDARLRDCVTGLRECAIGLRECATDAR